MSSPQPFQGLHCVQLHASQTMRSIRILAVLGALVGIVSAQAAPIVATNNTFGTFDRSSGTRNLVVTGPGAVADVDILIDFAKCDDPAIGPANTSCIGAGYAYLSETFFYLLSPTGTRVNLINTGTFTGGQGARVQINFDDAAASVVGGAAMSSGTFRGVQSLSAFNGQVAAGTWILGMGDSVGADPLSFFSARLTVNAVSEPASLGLLGLSMLVLGTFARRRQA